MRTEQQALKVSLAAILTFAILGVTFGLISGSYAIIFDGVFSLVDALMSVVSIVVAGLIARSTVPRGLSAGVRRRFSMGFWHFEPLILALNATVMIAVASYALVQSVLALLGGGRDIEFGPAIVYTVVILTMTTVVGVWEHRANKRIGSALVAMDVKGWIMAGGVTAALLVAFVIGLLIEGTGLAWMMPYVDPAVLTIVACVLIPVPVPTLIRALRELAMITPSSLIAEVERVAEQAAQRHDLGPHLVAAARIGRAKQVEITFHVPEDSPRTLKHWDDIRDEISAELGADDLNNWITIMFTTHDLGTAQERI